MKLEDIERQTFEDFGEITLFEVPPQDIDLVANDVTDVHPVQAHPYHAEPPKPGFSWAGFAGGLAALVWIGGAIGGPISYYGLDTVLTLDPAVQAAILALAFGPAVLFWLAAAAAAEAVKARRFAAELTRLAFEARRPVEAGHNSVQTLSHAVKSEIATLNDAVATALGRLNELQDAAQRNAQLFDNAIVATRENSQHMAVSLGREREALLELNADMRGQTETMAQSIGRQIRLMREASKLVKSELVAAEDALESRFAAFSATADTIAERTASFHHAADSATNAAGALNGTMGQMLDGLSEATRLTDTARQSTEQAVAAATETANAVRETTRNAVFEAKRAAQLIRAETAALQDAAAETLAQLQSAAKAAREASEESQLAADRHAATLEKRLSALAVTAASRTPAQARAVEPKPARSEHKPESNLFAAAASARADQRQQDAQPSRQENRGQRGFKGFGGWGNLMPQAREVASVKADATLEDADAFDLVAFGDKSNPDTTLKHNAFDMIAAAGVDLDDALAANDLEHIAAQSRNGAAARRRAVLDAAPGAVGRISRHVQRNSQAQAIANAFRARPDLVKSENAAESKEIVRAYLLIDAALS